MAVKPVRGFFLLATSLFLGLLGAAHAQDYGDQPESDPPDRAARLAYLKGDVSLQPAGEDEWAPAMLNRPLTTGDKLWTERGARVEIQVSQAAVRLDGETGFSFLNLDDDTVQMRMTAGTIIVDVRSLEDREQIEIDTPNLAISLLRPGSYRVEVNDAGDVTTVKIGEGEAEATGPSTNTLVHSGQVVTFRGVDELVTDTSTLGRADDFDNWSMDREHQDDRYASSGSSRYVSRDVTGYDDLDRYGSWSSEPEYGYVWTPRTVVVGWSPYRYGRWVWVGPWGWTWIDDAPWGYAPFHYGRWAHVRNRWCWVPGPRHVRAVYAPALVGWVGTRGPHMSWFPLGPRDVYLPGRRFSRHYVERVNIANTIVDHVRVRDAYDRRGAAPNYRNRAVPDAVTSVARETFTSAQRTGDRRVRLDPRDLRGAAGQAIAPEVSPGRESRLGGAARANPRLPAAVINRQVVVKREPPPSAARFARRVQPSQDVAQPPLRGVRPDREQSVEGRARGTIQDRVARGDERADRPQRNDHGANDRRDDREQRPDPQLSTSDPRSLQDRLRDERSQREAAERAAEDRQRWQHRDDRPDRERPERGSAREDGAQQYPQYSQRPQRTQDQVREAMARQLEQRDRQQQRERSGDDRSSSDRPPMERRDYRPEPRDIRPEPRDIRPEQREYRQREQPRQEQPRQEYRERRQEAPRESPRSEPRQQAPRQESQRRQDRSDPRIPRGRGEGRSNKE